MVVSKGEWNIGRGKNTLESQIREFLRKKYPEGRTVNEFIDDTGLEFDWKNHPIISFLGIWGIISTFDELVKKGELESKFIEGKGKHYRFKK